MTARGAIPFARPWITDDERAAVLEVLGGDILTHGPKNKAFEEEFTQFVGGGDAHSVAVSSCMAALHLVYMQLGIGPGDEVIVPAQTHVATAHAVEIMGARAVFADCDPRTGNMTAELIQPHITDRTCAIGLVHFLGIPCDMDPIMDLARQHGLKVIEDCALAVGATYKGTHVGLIGDAGCFSFYPVKHLTTGDGGMFITRHAELAEKVHKARGFGVDRTFSERSVPGMYDVPTLGLNYRMSDINAAIGRVQLGRVGQILELRRRHFEKLRAAIASLEHVRIIDAASEDTRNSCYCLSVVLIGPLADRRSEVIARLKAAGVGTSVYYPQPVPRMTYYREKYGYEPESYPEAAAISDQSIALPVGPHLNDDDVEYVGAAFASTVKELNS